MSAFSPDKLPASFRNEIEAISSNIITVRSNVLNMEDTNRWVKEFGERTNTQWNTRNSKPNGERFVCRKYFVCHHSSFMKVPQEENRKSISKNSNCLATISVRVKLNNVSTRKTDPFIAKGLVGVIVMNDIHNHSLNAAYSLKFLSPKYSKEKFFGYFNDGMGIMKSRRYHASVIMLKEGFVEEDIDNSRINPSYRTVQNWYNQWWILNPIPQPDDLIETRPSRKKRRTTKEDSDVDEPSTSSDSLNCVKKSTTADDFSKGERFPVVDADSRSENDVNKSKKSSQVSETKTKGGSLFQPPVIIEEEIEIVSSDRLPVKDTESKSVTDSKKSYSISRRSLLNSSGRVMFQPPVKIKKEIASPKLIPTIGTDQSVTDSKKSPLIFTKAVVSPEQLNTGSQSDADAQVPGCFPQVLLLNSSSGPLFQSPAMTQGGIISSVQLPAFNTSSQSVTDVKQSNCLPQILVLNSDGSLIQLPVIPSAGTSGGTTLLQLPVVPTPSTSSGGTSTPLAFSLPVMVNKSIVPSEQPPVNSDSQSVTDSKESDSQASETSLLQPTVMIKKEIVSPQRIPDSNTDAKKQNFDSQVSETKSGSLFQPQFKIKEENVSPERLPDVDTDSQSVTDTKESELFVSGTNSSGGSLFQLPVMIKDEIVSEDEL